MGRHYRLFLGILCLLGSGCSSNEVLVKKQMELEARLEQLVQGSAANNTRIAEVSNEVKELQNRLNTQAVVLEQLKSDHNDLKASYDTTSKITVPPPVPVYAPPASPTTKIEVVNQEPARPDKESTPQDAYMKAFGLFSSSNYQGAITAFEEFIKSYPDNEYAGNAQYWIGECYYTQKNFPKALAAFTTVLDKYPKGKKIPDAMLKVGFTHLSMNESAKGKTVLQSLLEKYPKSQAALKAREKLGRQ